MTEPTRHPRGHDTASNPAHAHGSTTVVDAPAKLTLSLRVTGRRDDGYHLIDAEMITLDLCDVLSIIRADTTSFTCGGPFSEGVPLDESNLVLRALHLANSRASVHLQKLIPHGGGLGGGSSDAAAILRWAGYTDLVAASRLGADIPFCMVGGRARVRGIGEIVEPLPTSPLTVTLIIPPLQVSTPAVYAAWDRLGGPTGDGPNDLEGAALVVEPELATWRDRIRASSGETPTLAGSGATWFLIGDHGHLEGTLGGATVVVAHSRP